MFKKVYLEITNKCNLDCEFCIKNCRPQKFLSTEEFKMILNKLEGFTKYLYFHILGEPLIHPKINEFINLARERYNVNITTNGYLLKRIENNTNVRQINISLHSYNEKYGISFDEYIENVFNAVDKLKKHTYISYRIWCHSPYVDKIIEKINEKYSIKLDVKYLEDNVKLANNIYFSTNQQFTWPDLNNSFTYETGSCYALKHHIGILVDGTVVPCCLDSKGIIKLGNIFKDKLNYIIKSERYQNMLAGFNNNRKIEILCKKCPINRSIKKFNII